MEANMNDFTKEELQNLLGMAKSIPIDDRILILKLESMIDNYCDHTWTDGSGNMIFCSKCHVYGGKR